MAAIHEIFIQKLETPPIAPNTLNFEMDIEINFAGELATMPLDDPNFIEVSSVNQFFYC